MSIEYFLIIRTTEFSFRNYLFFEIFFKLILILILTLILISRI